MQSSKSVEGILEEIISDEFGSEQSIKSISIVSKTGLMIAGRSASDVRAETFSAMSAIMFSAAETTRKDIIKEDMEKVMVVFSNSVVIISELSANLLVVAVASREIDEDKLMEHLDSIVDRSKAELTWLK
ncbi:MAG TPA: roadblock/LC7 domain-containing protein [Methanomassiliicoccales archaeon]|nr:roadblock/LC7 domain-containing protein [Methanomassiliicoccales archaeon]